MERKELNALGYSHSINWSVMGKDKNRADLIVGIIGDWIKNQEYIVEGIKS